MNSHAKDFVRMLLKAKPEERRSIGECVNHEWIASASTNTSTAETSSVAANLKRFAAQTTFSRMCITAVARQLDHTHLKDIHQVFRSMDADGNGVLSAQEIANGLQRITGESFDSKTFEEMFENLDMDGSRTIDYTEFCAAGLGQKSSAQDDIMWAAFKTFDLDNRGYISKQDLQRILDSADMKDSWTPQVCDQVGQEIISKFDKDGDGRITFDDWREIMQQCWNKKAVETHDGPEAVAGAHMGAYELLSKVSSLQQIQA
jgi:calcium-dependent protein kinase